MNKQESISKQNHFYSETVMSGIIEIKKSRNMAIRTHRCMGTNKQKSISGMNYFYSEATIQRIAALQMLISAVIQLYISI
jgi:hypothetical protein